MKTPASATSLTRLALLVGSMSGGFAVAQPAPPASAGLNGYAPGAVQPPMYQMPVPPRPPTPPPGPPPANYRPPTIQAPPGYRPMMPPPAAAKATAGGKSSKGSPKTTTTAVPKSNYRPATGGKSSTNSKGKTMAAPATVETRVSKLESNDHRQDLRLGRLERDVGLLPPTIEGGGMADIIPMGKTHIVRPGDTLFSVASRYHTSVGELRSLNRLSDETLDIGETLLIPDGQTWSAKPSHSTAVHVVGSEESFASIARMYGVTEDSIARSNPTVYASDLRRGERLVISNPVRVPVISPSRSSGGSSTGTTTTVVSSNLTHIVKKGEMLGRIATKHGISMSKLMAANGIKDPNKIVAGQRLLIPGRQTTRTVAAPAPAREDRDTTPLPNLRLVEADAEPAPVSLPPAAKLAPPPSAALPPIKPAVAAAPESAMPRGIVSYRAQRGDTLESVANHFGTSVANIRALNPSAGDSLKEGHELFVPTVGAVSVN